MRLIGRIMALLLIFSLIVLAAYSIYRFLLPLWVPFLFYAYLVAGVFVLLFAKTMLLCTLRNSRNFRDFLLASIVKAAGQEHSVLKTTQIVVLAVALAVEETLIWPIDVGQGILDHRNGRASDTKRYIAEAAMRILDNHHAFFPLIVICIALGLRALGVHADGYGGAFVSLMGLSISARHLRYATEMDGLPARLRRLTNRPYVSFIILIAADFVSLVIVFAIISPADSASALSIARLSESAKSLFQFRQLIKLFSGHHLPRLQILSWCAGLLFYIAYLRTVTNFREFKQQDTDRHWLAGRYNQQGRFALALRTLDRVGSPTKDTHVNKMIALLGINQLAQAEDEAHLSLDQCRVVVSREMVFRIIADCSVLVPMPANTLLAIVTKGKADCIRDVIMQDVVNMYIRIEPKVLEDITSIFLSGNADYPLTTAVILMHHDKADDARKILWKATPGTEIEEATRMVLLLHATVLDPATTHDEDAANFRKWIRDNLPDVIALLNEISDPLELEFGFGHIISVRLLASRLDYDLEEQITYYCDQIKKRVSGNAAGEAIVKVMEHRFNDLMSTEYRGEKLTW